MTIILQNKQDSYSLIPEIELELDTNWKSNKFIFRNSNNEKNSEIYIIIYSKIEKNISLSIKNIKISSSEIYIIPGKKNIKSIEVKKNNMNVNHVEEIIEYKKKYNFFYGEVYIENKLLYPYIKNSDILTSISLDIKLIDHFKNKTFIKNETFIFKDSKLEIKEPDIYSVIFKVHILLSNIDNKFDENIKYKIAIEKNNNNKWEEINGLCYCDMMHKYNIISHCDINGLLSVDEPTLYRFVFSLLSPLRKMGKNTHLSIYTGNLQITPLIREGKNGLRGLKGETGDKGETGLKGETGDKGDKGDKGLRGHVGPSCISNAPDNLINSESENNNNGENIVEPAILDFKVVGFE